MCWVVDEGKISCLLLKEAAAAAVNGLGASFSAPCTSIGETEAVAGGAVEGDSSSRLLT